MLIVGFKQVYGWHNISWKKARATACHKGMKQLRSTKKSARGRGPSEGSGPPPSLSSASHTSVGTPWWACAASCPFLGDCRAPKGTSGLKRVTSVFVFFMGPFWSPQLPKAPQVPDHASNTSGFERRTSRNPGGLSC